MIHKRIHMRRLAPKLYGLDLGNIALKVKFKVDNRNYIKRRKRKIEDIITEYKKEQWKEYRKRFL